MDKSSRMGFGLTGSPQSGPPRNSLYQPEVGTVHVESVSYFGCPLASAIGVLLLVFMLMPRAWAADYREAQALFYAGEYDACAEMAKAEVEKGIWNDVWSRQLIRTLLVQGKYSEAKDVYESVAVKFSSSIPLRVLAAEAYRHAGEPEKGNQLLDEIPQILARARYFNRDNLLAIGRYLLDEGEDARTVLEAFYDRALRTNQNFVEAHVAIAELALDKADYQEAVKSLERSLELRPEDPHIRYLLARAWSPSDSEKATENLQAALEINERHPESLQLSARNLIDRELYEEAEGLLDELFAVNPKSSIAWALKASIAHLRGEYRKEKEFRDEAMSTWSVNPEVDFLIGQVLSKHYRFADSVTYQRRSLRLDPGFLPARFQLAQDLLRVGEDAEGWSIVDQVSAADQYNVVAYNLKTLQKRIEQFEVLEVPGFIIRMDAREARIYGPRVVSLLQEARDVLSAKYAHELEQPVTVEIFPEQNDFAIRTFGLPGGAGFLGVCFGSLITANSPASQGDSPSNWESVLWHEFCHVITLQKTKNRMPRWLSEGISVYEEVQRDSTWGQRMTPLYKQMILGDEFVPLSELSSAFLSPKSPVHLQFAYYESSLAVRYLIEVHGHPLLLKLLDDLGMGVTTEEAFLRRYGDPDALDEDFQRYVSELANNFFPNTDFERNGLPEQADAALFASWLEEHPNSFFAHLQIANSFLREGSFEQAEKHAQRLIELYPESSEPDGAWDLLARIHRELGNADREQAALTSLVDLACDNVPALVRLIALTRDSQQWQEMAEYSDKLLAVQPLIATGHEGVVEAASHLGNSVLVLNSLSALQEMEPVDPAGLHFTLAKAHFDLDQLAEARFEVLRALEETPRYRDAQKLLVKIQKRRHETPKTLPVVLPIEGNPPSPQSSVEASLHP